MVQTETGRKIQHANARKHASKRWNQITSRPLLP